MADHHSSESSSGNSASLDAALEDILAKESPYAYSTFSMIEQWLKQFHIYPRVQAHDILIEAYLRGRRVVRRGVIIHNPHAWLKKTAFWVVREKARELRRHAPISPHCEEHPDHFDDLLAEQKELQEELKALRRAFRRLQEHNPEGAKIVVLKWLLGLSWEQVRDRLIQEAIDVPSVEALRQRGSRAKKDLRRLLHSESGSHC